MKSSQKNRPAFPWFTLAAATLAVGVHLFPALTDTLLYDRELVRHGDWWRLWTGHWVHFSAGHLGWNLAVLIPAGIWAERLKPVRTRWLLAVGPAAIGLALLALAPDLARYGGLSGLAAGILAWLALSRRGDPGADRWFWNAVLALLGMKIIGELVTGHALLADLGGNAARPVPAAHIAGIACAVVARFVPRFGKKPESRIGRSV